MPMVFDWAIRNETCKDVENKSSYICGGNSTCIDSDNGSGYHCECNNGYHGNPYLHHDCQGIDLCIYIKFFFFKNTKFQIMPSNFFMPSNFYIF